MPAITPFITQPFHQRADAIDAHALSWFLFASVPALLAGLWAMGFSHPDGVSLAAGLSLWLPRLVIALLFSYGWAVAFSRARGHSVDAGWWYIAWLFVLLLPAAIPLPLVAIGLSFGLLFGCHAFGGTGRYIVNPALLGAVFLSVAYPAAIETQSVATGSNGATWWSAARESGTTVLGASSPLLCLAGLLFLVVLGRTSWRVPAGALTGLLMTAWAFGAHPWYWQAVSGSFALALAFVASDPTTVPESRAGQWTLGLLFGALTVILRTLNPEHPEGSLYALLLATLASPLVDHWATTRQAGRLQ